jgi:hypothetical protein
MPYQINPSLTGFACLRCGRTYPPEHPAADRGRGCSVCLDEGFPASLTLTSSL